MLSSGAHDMHVRALRNLRVWRPGSFCIRSCEPELKDFFMAHRHAVVVVYLYQRRLRNV